MVFPIEFHLGSSARMIGVVAIFPCTEMLESESEIAQLRPNPAEADIETVAGTEKKKE